MAFAASKPLKRSKTDRSANGAACCSPPRHRRDRYPVCAALKALQQGHTPLRAGLQSFSFSPSVSNPSRPEMPRSPQGVCVGMPFVQGRTDRERQGSRAASVTMTGSSATSHRHLRIWIRVALGARDWSSQVMNGLLSLLDDVVALTKLAAVTIDDAAGQAARAGAKAAGVVIDDAAVTPRYVTGLAAQRELPIVARIAIGSLKNKLFFLLPAALLLSSFLPQAITPLLMLGVSTSVSKATRRCITSWQARRMPPARKPTRRRISVPRSRTRRWPARSGRISSCPRRSWPLRLPASRHPIS